MEMGRDPASVRRMWVGGCACATTQAEAEDLAGNRFSTDNDDAFGFVGTPQQVIGQMQRFADLGVDCTLCWTAAAFPNRLHLNCW
jgi:alkanesulfonate monooxygenase SsuD/methylene tetrahydromethanopterin reductase-like flavin-dependent oxidoreductase (luciferase family)